MSELPPSSLQPSDHNFLGSFPQYAVAIVFGSSGGIGGAVVQRLRSAGCFEQLVGFSRNTSPPIDLLDEGSLSRGRYALISSRHARLDRVLTCSAETDVQSVVSDVDPLDEQPEEPR